MQSIKAYREQWNLEQDRLFAAKYPEGRYTLSKDHRGFYGMYWLSTRRATGGDWRCAGIRHYKREGGQDEYWNGWYTCQETVTHYASLAGLLDASERRGVPAEVVAEFTKRLQEKQSCKPT